MGEKLPRARYSPIKVKQKHVDFWHSPILSLLVAHIMEKEHHVSFPHNQRSEGEWDT